MKEFREKFIRDPIHGLIKIDSAEALAIINSKSFQRLREIKQLGFTYLVYPGAEHTRFTHSLGVYHLSKRMYNQLVPLSKQKPKDKTLVELTALLHDIGHGPFSHQLEEVLKSEIKYKHYQKHEKWSIQIIKNELGLTKEISKSMTSNITKILNPVNNKFYKTHLKAIISSQFDVDRFDYMLRDSYMTGVNYGRFDLDWIFRNISLEDIEPTDPDNEKYNKKTIAINGRRGISSLENYLIGNFQLYQNVYFHKTILAANTLFSKILKRAIILEKDKLDSEHKNPIQLTKIANDRKLLLEDYLELTDTFMWNWIKKWNKITKDPILQDLTKRLLSRKLFKSVELKNTSYQFIDNIKHEIIDVLSTKNFDSNYYFSIYEPTRIAYDNLFSSMANGIIGNELWVKEDGNSKAKTYTEFSHYHTISDAILKLEYNKQFIIYPEEVTSKVNEILK